MGTWFCKEFLAHHYEVVGWGRNAEKLEQIQKTFNIPVESDIAQAITDADFIVLATPLDTIREVVSAVANAATPGAILFDILSVKGDSLPSLGELCSSAGVEYVSTHPMFGPGANSLEGRNVIVTPLPEFPRSAKKVSSLFSEMGAIVTEVEAAFIDKMMAFVLNLPHFINILFGGVSGGIWI